MPLFKSAPIKSAIRTEWDQENEGTISGNTQVYWSASSTFNVGSMFSYIYDAGGYTRIQINRDGVVIISLSLGSQGTSWSSLSLMTNLLNEATGGVVDVFYELPIPNGGSLYPTSSCLIRKVFAGELYSVSVVPSGADITYGDINTLSAWAMAEA
jgi:hypothetical protein